MGFPGEAAGDEFVGAEGTVGQQEIVRLQMACQHGGGLGVMLGVRAGLDVLPAAMTEIEQADDAHGGETTAGLLHGWLRIEPLVFPGVHQVDGTAIHRHQGESAPLVFPTDAAGKLPADALVNGLDEGKVQPAAGLAITGGIRRGNRQIAAVTPALDKSHGLLTGGVGFKDLGEPSPEYRQMAEAALTPGWDQWN